VQVVLLTEQVRSNRNLTVVLRSLIGIQPMQNLPRQLHLRFPVVFLLLLILIALVPVVLYRLPTVVWHRLTVFELPFGLLRNRILLVPALRVHPLMWFVQSFVRVRYPVHPAAFRFLSLHFCIHH